MLRTFVENEPSTKPGSGFGPASMPRLRLTSATLRGSISCVSRTAAAFREDANTSISVVSPLYPS